ncbi:hypothetical protein AALP_AA3G282300 [Arabis alpina]|uniref:Protein kinase domain-containing protein n=1 Tax=Arabis alpina TaxID=50452 RepID=A0A087HC91_ARAAL|nr:hypothetical protein AALP_AA3G282300 [Arabis alpina]
MGNTLKSFKPQPPSMVYEPLISVSEKENLRVFRFTELKKATNKFRQEMFTPSRRLEGTLEGTSEVFRRDFSSQFGQTFGYLHKGSLDCQFYGKEEVLPWEIRIKIAIGTAQGLAFIHSIKNSSLFEDLRMHNIMLDEVVRT